MGKHSADATTTDTAVSRRANRTRRDNRKKSSSLGKKIAAISGAWALLLTMLVGVGLFNAPEATAAEWPHAGDRGTIQGHVYIDSKGYVRDFNKVLGDKAIPGVKMNAVLLKKDGTLITGHNAQNLPVPLRVVSDDDGYYSFNFRPLMIERFGADAHGDQLKIAKGDQIRVWPDESNYEQGGALEGLTPKRLNGGTRFAEIRTDNLAWIGTTNYVHGSASRVNMAFRPVTEYTTVDNETQDKDQGKHLPVAQWKPTTDHNIPDINPIGAGDEALEKGYICGHAYSDVKYRYDRWDNGGEKNAKAHPDRVLPGVRVVLTTYNQTWNGKLQDANTTRYDFSDKDGRWCVAFKDVMDEVNDKGNPADLFMLTVETPRTEAEIATAQEQFDLVKQGNEEKYDGVTIQTANAAGLPEGFASVGLNGWHGTIRPVGDWASLTNSDVVGYWNTDPLCVTRGSYCFPDLQFWDPAPVKGKFGANGAHLGFIPTQVDFTPDRYSHEANRAEPMELGFELQNVSTLDPDNVVVMVAEGADPSDKNNWVAESGIVSINPTPGQPTTGTITIPKTLPKDNYSFYTYAYDQDTQGEPYNRDKVDVTRLQDIDTYRITNTEGHYYTSGDERQTAYNKLDDGTEPAPSVTKVTPGTDLFNAYQDLGEKAHKVWLHPRGTNEDGTLLDKALLADVDDPNPSSPEYTKNWKQGIGQDHFTIPQNTEPGLYDIVVYNGYGEEVDRKPLEVSGPKMQVEPNTVYLGHSAAVTLTDLNPDTTYTLTFTPKGAADSIVVTNVKSDDSGNATRDIAIPSQDNGGSAYGGLGKVTLTKKDQSPVLASRPLTVKAANPITPEIILPGMASDDSGFIVSEGGWSPCDRVKSDCDITDFFPIGTRYQSIDRNKDVHVRVHAVDPKTQRVIPAGDNSTGQWSLSYKAYIYDSGQKKFVEGTGRCQTVNSSGDNLLYFNDGAIKREDCLFGIEHGDFYVMDISYKDNETQLTDTKKFVARIENRSPVNLSMGWDSIAVELNEGDYVPENTYCMKYSQWNSEAPSGKATGFGKSNTRQPGNRPNRPDKNPWPGNLDIDANGCLRTLDGSVAGNRLDGNTNDEWIDVFARATIEGTKYDQHYYPGWNTSRKVVVPPTIRVKIHPDVEPPTITATTTDNKEVADGDTLTVTQGDSLPLQLSAKDNASLADSDGFIISTNELVDDEAEVEIAPEADYTVVDGRRQGVIDYSNQPVNLAPGVYTVIYQAEDKAGNITTLTVNVEVLKRPIPPVFEDAETLSGKVGVPFGPWTIPVTDPDEDGGITDMAVVEGKLPSGLRLMPTVVDGQAAYVIHGTPQKPTEGVDVTVEATDVEGATATHTYHFTIEDADPPVFDEDATPQDEYVLEVGVPLSDTSATQKTIPLSGTCNGGIDGAPQADVLFYNKKTQLRNDGAQGADNDREGNSDFEPLPEGLVFEDGKISGTPSRVNFRSGEAIGDGIDYVAVLSCPGDKEITHDITIKVQDTVAPEIDVDDTIQVKEGTEASVAVRVNDKSFEEVTLSDATCTREEPAGSLTLTPEDRTTLTGTYFASDGVMTVDDHGIYECEFTATDASGNASSDSFELQIRDDGPLLIITPTHQQVTTHGVPTEISTISVTVPDAGTDLTGGQDCADKLSKHRGSDVTWDAHTLQLTGKIADLADTEYVCEFTAILDGKETVRTTTIDVDGPIAGPDWDGEAFNIHGIVGRNIEATIKVDMNGDLLPNADDETTLNAYFQTDGSPNWNYDKETGTFTGVPSKAVPSGIVFNLNATISKDEFDPVPDEDVTFTVPVRISVDPAPKYTGVPSTAAPERSFTPIIRNPEKGRTYTMTLTKMTPGEGETFSPEASNCPDTVGPITVAAKAEESDTLTLPARTADASLDQCKYQVIVTDDKGHTITGTSDTLTIGKIWIEMPNPYAGMEGQPPTIEMPEEMPAPGGMPVMGKFFTGDVDHKYTVELCQAWVEPLCSPEGKLFTRDEVIDGTDQDFADPPFVLPLVDYENPEHNTYKLVVYDQDDRDADGNMKLRYQRTINTVPMAPTPWDASTQTGAKVTVTADENKNTDGQPWEESTVTVTAVVKDQFGNRVPDAPVTVVTPDGVFHTATTQADGTLDRTVTYIAGAPDTAQVTQLYGGHHLSGPPEDAMLYDSASLTPTKNQDVINEPVFTGGNASRVEITTGEKTVAGSIGEADIANKHTITVTFRNKYGDAIAFDDIDTSKLQITASNGWSFGPDTTNMFHDDAWRAGTVEGTGKAPTIIDIASSKSGVVPLTVSYGSDEDGWTPIAEKGQPLSDTTLSALFVAEGPADNPATGTTCDDGNKPSYIATSVDNKTANGSDKNVLTIVLRDKYCNPVSIADEQLQTITTAATGDNAASVALATPVIKSGNRDGVFYQEATSTVADTYTVTLTGPIQLTAGTDMTFVPGPVAPAQSTFDVSTGHKVAGQENHIVTITVKDAHSNLKDLPDESLYNLIVNLTGGTQYISKDVQVGTPEHTSTGVYTVTLSSPKAGTAKVKSVSWQPVSTDSFTNVSNDLAVFVADAPTTEGTCDDGKAPSYIQSTGPSEANGTQRNTVTVVLRDANCNPVTGQTLTAKANSDLIPTTPTYTEDVDNSGHYTTTVASTKAGSHEVAITAPVELSTTTVFEAGALNDNTSTLQIYRGKDDQVEPETTSSVTAGDWITVKLTPYDADTNIVDLGDTATVTLPGDNGTVTLTQQEDGTYVGTARPTTVSQAPASNAVVTTPDAAGITAPLAIKAGPIAQAVPSTDSIDAEAGSEISQPPSFTFQDQWGNVSTDNGGKPVYITMWTTDGTTDRLVTQTVDTVPADGVVQVDPFKPREPLNNVDDDIFAYAKDPSTGDAQPIGAINVNAALGSPSRNKTELDFDAPQEGQTVSTTAGDGKVTLTMVLRNAGGIAIGNYATGDNTQQRLSVKIDTIVNGEEKSQTIIAKTDANGNIIARDGLPIEFVASDYDKDNTVTIYLSDDATGTHKKSLSKKSLKNEQATVTVVPDNSFATISSGDRTVTDSKPAQADGDHKHTVTVTLKNKYGDVVAHSDDVLTVDTGEESPRIGTWQSDEQATSHADVTSTKAGTIGLTVKYCADGVAEPQSCVALTKQDSADTTLNATFVADTTPATEPAAGETCDDGNKPSYINNIGLPAMADGADWIKVQVMLRDTFCNPINGIADNINGTPEDKLTWASKGFTPVEGRDGLYETTVTSTKRNIDGYSVSVTVGDVTVKTINKDSQEQKARFDWTYPNFFDTDNGVRFYVKDGPVTADGEATNTIVIKMKDINGNPVVGTNIAARKPNIGLQDSTGGMDVTDWLSARYTNKHGDPDYPSEQLVWPEPNTPSNPMLEGDPMTGRSFKPVNDGKPDEHGYGVYEMTIASTAAGKAGIATKCVAKGVDISPKVVPEQDGNVNNPANVALFEAGAPSFDTTVTCDGQPASYVTATTGATVGGNIATGPADKRATVDVVLRDKNCNPVTYDRDTAQQKITLKTDSGYLDGQSTVSDIRLGNKDGHYQFSVVSDEAKSYQVAADVTVDSDTTGTVSWDSDKNDPVTTAFVAGSLVTDGALTLYEQDGTTPLDADTATAGDTITVVLSPQDAQGNMLDYGDSVTAVLPAGNGSVTLNKQDDGTYRGTQKVTTTTLAPANDVIFPPGTALEGVSTQLIVVAGTPKAHRDGGTQIMVIPGEATPDNDVWTVADEYGNIIPEGTPLYVSYPTVEGTTATHNVTVTHDNGKSVIKVPAIDVTAQMDGKTVTIHTATPTTDVNNVGQAVLNTSLRGDPSTQSTLSASPDNPVELTGVVTVTGVLKDGYGNPISRYSDPLMIKVTKLNEAGEQVTNIVELTTNNQGKLVTKVGGPVKFNAGAWAAGDSGTNRIELIVTNPEDDTETVLATASVQPAKDPDKQGDPVVDTDNPTAKSYAWIKTTDNAAANKKDFHTIHVVLKDKYGDPVELSGSRYLHPYVDADRSPQYFDQKRVNTEDRGKVNLWVTDFVGGGEDYTAKVTSSKQGEAVLVVKVYDGVARAISADTNFTLPMVEQPAPAAQTITGLPAPFRSGSYDPGMSTVEVVTTDGEEIPSDGVPVGTPVRIVFTPKDANGNVITDMEQGATVTALVPVVGTGEPVKVALTQQADGTYEGKWANSGEGTAVTKAGKYPIETTVKPSADADEAVGPTSKAIVVNAGDPAGTTTTVTFDPKASVPGQDTTVTVTVKDSYGNPVDKGTKVKIKAPGKDEPIDVVVGANGVAFMPKSDDPDVASSDKPTFVPDAGGEGTVGVTTVDDVGLTTQNFFAQPKPPTNLKANEKKLTGTVEKNVPENSTVTVYHGEEPLGTATVNKDDDGTTYFEFAYPDTFTPGDSDKLYATVTADYDGQGEQPALTSAKAGPVTANLKKPDKPTVTVDKANPRTITGQVNNPVDNVDKVEVCVTKADSETTTCFPATVNDDKTYTATVPDDVLQLTDDDVVTTKVTDKQPGNTSETSKTVDFTGPVAPTVTPQYKDNGTVTVTVKPDDPQDVKGAPKVSYKDANDNTVTVSGDALDGPDNNGSYRFTIPLEKRGTQLTVSATFADAEGNDSEPGTAIVDRKETPEVTGTNANLKGVTGNVAAEIPINSTVTVTDNDGNTIVTGSVTDQDCPIGASKCFAMTWPDPWPQEAQPIAHGDTVKISVTDSRTGVASDDVSQMADMKGPKVTPQLSNGKTVTATINPDDSGAYVVVTYTTKDNTAGSEPAEVECTDTTPKTCSFSVDLPNSDPTQDIAIKATDISGNTTTQPVTVDSVKPTVKVSFTSVSGETTDTVTGTVTDPNMADDATATITYTYTDNGEEKEKVVTDVTLTCRGEGSDRQCTFSEKLTPAPDDKATITVTAADKVGNRGTGTTIADKSTDTPQFAATDGLQGNTVTITAETGSTVTISYVDQSDDDHEQACDETDTPGQYQCELDASVTNGTDITATVTDPVGNTATNTYTVNRQKVTITSDPTNGTTVRGSVSDPQATVTVEYYDKGSADKKTATATVDADGQIFARLGNNTDTDKPITIVANKDGDIYEKEVPVDLEAPAAPTIDEITADGIVKGTGEKGATVTVTLPGGTVIDDIVVDEDGNWNVAIPDGTTLKHNDTITATQTDKAGNTSDQGSYTHDIENTLDDVAISDEGDTVTGTTDPGSIVIVTDKGGNTIAGPVIAGDDGTFTVTIPADKKPSPGDSLTVQSEDPNGNQATQPVTYNPTKPDKPTVTTTPDNKKKVTGTVSISDKNVGQDATVDVCLTTDPHKGCYAATITADPKDPTKGTYVIDDLPRELTHGETITVKVTNTTNDKVTTATKVVDYVGPDEPSVAHTVNDDGSATVTITPADKDDVSGKPDIIINGKAVDKSKVSGPASDGSYTVQIPLTDRGKDCTVKATFTDSDNNPSDAGQTTVPRKETPDMFNPAANMEQVSGDVDSDIPAGSTVTVTDADGTTIGTGKVVDNGDGTKSFVVTYDNDKKPKDKDTITVVVTDKRTGVDSPGTQVTVDGQGPTVTPQPSNGDTVTATINADDQDATVVVTYTDDNGTTRHVDATLTCEDDSTSCVVRANIADADPTKPVTIKATDTNGNTTTVDVPLDVSTPQVTVDATKGDTVSGAVTDPDGLGDTPVATVTYTDKDGTKRSEDVPLTCNDDKSECTFDMTLPNGPAKDATDITVTVTDPVGNKGHATTTADQTGPSTPTVNDTDGLKGDVITGVTTEPDGDVTITYIGEDGKEKTCEPVTIDASTGQYSCTLPERVKNGTTISVVATDAVGNPCDEAGTTTIDRDKPKLNVDPTNGERISGDTTPGSTVEVTYTDTNGEEQTVTVPVNNDGTFEAELPDDVDATQPITIAADKDGVTTTKTVTPDTQAPTAPSDIDVSDDGTTVTGQGEPAATVTVTLPDGTDVTGIVGDDGTFTVVLPEGKTLSEGDVITVTQTDPAGNDSKPTQYLFDKDNRVDNPIISDEGAQVSGTTDPGSTVELFDGNGQKLGEAVADSAGQFVIEIPPAHAPQAGDVLTIVSTDPVGNTAQRDVVYTPPKPDAPTIDEVTDTHVHGTAPTGTIVEVCVTRLNGEVECIEGDVDDNGTYSIEIKGAPLQPGEVVVVRAIDPTTGAVSDATRFIKPGDEPTVKPVANLSKTGANSDSIGIVAALLTVAGACVLMATRRRNRTGRHSAS